MWPVELGRDENPARSVTDLPDKFMFMKFVAESPLQREFRLSLSITARGGSFARDQRLFQRLRVAISSWSLS